jgi:hypothetical protein
LPKQPAFCSLCRDLFAILLPANKKFINISLASKRVIITAFHCLYYFAFEVPAGFLAKSQFAVQHGRSNTFVLLVATK